MSFDEVVAAFQRGVEAAGIAVIVLGAFLATVAFALQVLRGQRMEETTAYTGGASGGRSSSVWSS